MKRSVLVRIEEYQKQKVLVLGKEIEQKTGVKVSFNQALSLYLSEPITLKMSRRRRHNDCVVEKQ